MSNFYRGPSKDASYPISVHLVKQFQRKRFFRNQPIRNKNCLWWPCLLIDQDKMCKLYRGPTIDASYQVSVHLAKGFQRRRLKCEKLTDDRRRMPSDGKSSHCLWQGELKMIVCKWNRISVIFEQTISKLPDSNPIELLIQIHYAITIYINYLQIHGQG